MNEEIKNEKKGHSRRNFLKNVGLVAVSTPVLETGLNTEAFAGNKTQLKLPPQENDNYIVQMMKDLERALKKPIAERKWGMVIDTRKCFGCKACTIGCAVENGLPPGIMYRPVYEEYTGKYPNVSLRHIPRPCQHCDNPICLSNCPLKDETIENQATYKRADGVVIVNYQNCIGCGNCVSDCPYGARTNDDGKYFNEKHQPYEDRTTFEYNEITKREADLIPNSVARKCHYCLHRVEDGRLPMCTTTCIGNATYFGDLNDATSLVSQIAKDVKTIFYKEDAGTKPTVKYIV